MRELENFRNLSVLVVGGRPSSVQVLRTVLGLAGFGTILTEPDSTRAIELLCDRPFDAVFCDERSEAVTGVAFPLAARRVQGVLNPMVPIFLLCSAARLRQVEQARDTGVSDVLARPVSASTIIRKMKLAIARPRPFIVAPDFFGPDRRGERGARFDGHDRRKRTARKVKVAPAGKTDREPVEL